MSGQSRNRDAYEAKMAFNPEKKAELLAASPFRKHKRQVAQILKKVKNAQKAVNVSAVAEGIDIREDLLNIQQGPL